MKSLFFGTQTTAASTSATNYIYPAGSNVATPSSTEAIRQIPMPVAGTIRNFAVTHDVAPSSGKSWFYSVHKNGAATGVSVTIADTAVSAVDSTNSFAFQPGDLISIAVVPTGTPTAPGIYYWDMEVNAAGQIIIGGNGNTPSNSATNYTNLQGPAITSWTATETNVQGICPTGGTISNLYVHASGAANTGASYTFTVRDGGDTALTCAISGSSQTDNSDLTHSFTVAAGDKLALKCVPASTPAARSFWWSCLFTPTVDGESWFSFGNSAVPSASATNTEQGFLAGANGWNATEANVKGFIGPQTLKNFYVSLVTAPGGVTTRKFTVRKNAGDTALNPTITGAATTQNVTADVSFARGDQFDIHSELTGSPAAATGGVHMGFLVYNAPAARRRPEVI